MNTSYNNNKIRNERRIVVTGLSLYPSSLIVAYMFDKCFVNIGYYFGNSCKFEIEPNTDYIFQSEKPPLKLVKQLSQNNSSIVVLTPEQKSLEYVENKNITWINDSNPIKSAYRLLLAYGANLLPITQDKILRIRSSDTNFRIVLDTLINGIITNEVELPFYLEMIFKKINELFELSIHEIDLIAKYLFLADKQYANLNVERTTMIYDDCRFDTIICETNKKLILEYLRSEYLEYENLVPMGKPADLVMITHHHFQTNETCVYGYYNSNLVVNKLKKIPNITINEINKSFSIRMKKFNQFFGNEDQTNFKH